jgi:hypothetical protein
MDRIECREFEARIHQVLDERRSLLDDSALARHRAECPDCQSLLDEYSRLLEMLPPADVLAARADGLGMEFASPKIGSTAGVARRVVIRGNSRGTPRLVGVALAAATLIMLLSLPMTQMRLGERHEARLATLPTPQLAPNALSSFAAGAPRTQSGFLLPPESQVLTQQAQQFFATIEGLPANLEGIEPYYLYTASITGVSTLTTSFNLTVDLLYRRLSAQPRSNAPAPSRTDHSYSMGQLVCVA